MDRLNLGRESYTIDKKKALLMHGAGPFHMKNRVCTNQNPQNQHFLFQFHVAQRFARAPTEIFRQKFIELGLKLS